jgi:hypothetical protein
VDTGSRLEFYRLLPEQIRSLSKGDPLPGTGHGELAGDSSWFRFDPFDASPGGVRRYDLRRKDTLYRGTVPDSGRYTLSFWFEGVDRDLWPRTRLWLRCTDASGAVIDSRSTELFRELVLREGHWGLAELETDPLRPGTRIELIYQNELVRSGELIIDNFLIRKSSGKILHASGRRSWLNNRKVSRAE